MRTDHPSFVAVGRLSRVLRLAPPAAACAPLLSLVLLGCSGGAPPAPRAEVLPSPPPFASAGPSARALDAAPPLAVEPLAAPEVACSFGAHGVARLDEGSRVRLCDASGARCYLESVQSSLHDGATSLLVGERAPGLFVELSYGGLRVRGFVGPAAEHYLFATRPLVLGRVFVPQRVEVRAAAPGRVTIAAAPELVLRAPEPLVGEVGCADVSPNSPWWPPEDIAAALGAEGTASTATLRAGEVRFATSPKAALDGVLTLPEPLVVEAYPARGARRRVTVFEDGGTFSAWFDARELGPAPPPGPLFSGSSGRGRYWVVGPTRDPGRVCARDVELVAVVDGHALSVGTVPAGQLISTRGAGLPGFVELALRHPVAENVDEGLVRTDARVELVPGASLQVRRSDVEGCPFAQPDRRRR